MLMQPMSVRRNREAEKFVVDPVKTMARMHLHLRKESCQIDLLKTMYDLNCW